MADAAGPRVWFDINIGDAAAYAEAKGAHDRAAAFLVEAQAKYGFGGEALSALSADERESLSDLYASDPAWAAKGDLSIDAPPPLLAGRLVIALSPQDAPKACENFRCLITGEKGIGKGSGKLLHYAGTRFHRIVKDFCCQGGDVVRGDGSGGDSIYGGKFNDEKGGLARKHAGLGVVSMANGGKNSNSSQFFFTLSDAGAPQCDGKHVVLGQVTEGLEVLRRINAEAATASGAPAVDVAIAACGVCS